MYTKKENHIMQEILILDKEFEIVCRVNLTDYLNDHQAIVFADKLLKLLNN